MIKLVELLDESGLYSDPRRTKLLKKAMKPLTNKKSWENLAKKAQDDETKKKAPKPEVDENKDNAAALANSGAFGKSFDPKYNKHNTPGTNKKDGQDGKKKGAMPGMVG